MRPEAGDLILYGTNSGSEVLLQLALVYRDPTQEELSAASIAEPAVVAVPMSSASPGLFITGNPATYPAANTQIVPLSIITATYKAYQAQQSLFAAAVPFSLPGSPPSPWTSAPTSL
jgi:hypothetical protein